MKSAGEHGAKGGGGEGWKKRNPEGLQLSATPVATEDDGSVRAGITAAFRPNSHFVITPAVIRPPFVLAIGTHQ